MYVLAISLFLIEGALELAVQIYAQFYGGTMKGAIPILFHVFLGLFGVSLYGKKWKKKHPPHQKNETIAGAIIYSVVAVVLSFPMAIYSTHIFEYLEHNKLKLDINGDSKYILNFSHIERALKNLDSGKDNFIVVTNFSGDFMQTIAEYKDTQNPHLKYYLVEHEENGKLFRTEFFLSQDEAIEAFSKFIQSDNTFKTDRTWFHIKLST